MKNFDKKILNGLAVLFTVLCISFSFLSEAVYAQGEWTATSTLGAPSPRINHAAVWTGSEMIIWGGNPPFLNTGGIYNLQGDTWASTSTVNAPSARMGHTGVWSGTDMIIWGGGSSAGGSNTGGVYNPETDSWTPTSTVNAPDPRILHTAVWIGDKMMVWGGQAYSAAVGYYNLNTGGLYDPATDTWTATSTVDAPQGRQQNVMVWTGSKVIIWGGVDIQGGLNFLQTGAVYDPSTDTWTSMSTTNAPQARVSPCAVWTGSKMIIFGGGGVGGQFNTGGIYDPETDTWTSISLTNAPSPRIWHVGVWTGSYMIVWGGYDQSGPTVYNDGGLYDPATDAWTAMPTANAPTARQYAKAVWTGSQMIVWGGAGTDLNAPYNTGGIFTVTVPVELTSFTYELQNNNIMLLWKTATETNNQGFEIQRKTNNSDWETIGFKEGKGTTTELSSYFFVDNNISSGTYTYRLKQLDLDGSFSFSNEIEVDVNTLSHFALSQNYPNPFNPSTKINFTLPDDAFVTLRVYNTLGEQVVELVNGFMKSGSHEVTFNASDLSSGIYYYRIELQNNILIKKLTLLK